MAPEGPPRACAGLKIKVLKDQGLEFVNSIPSFFASHHKCLLNKG